MRNRHFFLIDLLLLPAAAVLAFALRLDTISFQRQGAALLAFTALIVPVQVITGALLGLYRRYWRYASVDELALVAGSVTLASVVGAALLFALLLPWAGIRSFPRSVVLIDWLLALVAVGGPRFAVRLIERERQRRRRKLRLGPEKRILVIGAGNAGCMIVKEMQANPQLGMIPAGFVDDDCSKQGADIHGVTVLGGRKDIPRLVRECRVSEVIIAMPTAPGDTIRKIVQISEQAGVAVRTIPGIYELLSGKVGVRQIREVRIEDLLRRDPVRVDEDGVAKMIQGARLLVTGAGGSIGSEICRQAANFGVAELVLLGHGENSLFQISRELQRNYPHLALHAVVADIRDRRRLEATFRRHRPQVVFHAAAHKHVPLMEANVEDAVTNNILGTRNLVEIASAHGVQRFVLISTDKAVNPTSIMGATKRVAELIVQDAARENGRDFVAVRFGNVLGSRGSVIPTFQEQIARGGPVTVTHPDVRRYFMTIPEAVQLVMQAAALGRGGEVFVLDMGEPVRIADLAYDLITLSGFEPDRDVKIAFTGLRPGEKLFEELFIEGEEYRQTCHEQIFMARNGFSAPPADLPSEMDLLLRLARAGKESAVRQQLRRLVPEYTPAGTVPVSSTPQQPCLPSSLPPLSPSSPLRLQGNRPPVS
ncbi:MAG: polysaccharide biosynthesis protein [Chloroflexi bacterium]|nr:polysaccharide biosynthesis protein [Chloroflexota bacterium]